MTLTVSPSSTPRIRRAFTGSATVIALLVATLVLSACGSARIGVGVSAHVHSGPVTVGIGYFHDHLSPFGDWIWIPRWGWTWRPWGVGLGWVPYTDGHWVYTELGWYWVSYLEWGWAPFHYGRWGVDPIYGWVWVPGTVWAPSWVAWRHGPGWIGWAPLPPGARWHRHSGLEVRDVDFQIHAWSFVRDRDFLDRRIGSRIEPRARNVTLTERTRTSVRFEASGEFAADRGLPPDVVERAVGRKLERRPIVDSARSPGREREGPDREGVRAYRPEVRAAPAPAPPAQRAERTPPAIGRTQRDDERLQKWAEDERRRLERAQEQEKKTPPPDVTQETLARRQEAERKALREEIERRKQWVPQAPPKQKPASPPKEQAQPKGKEKPKTKRKPPPNDPPGGAGR